MSDAMQAEQGSEFSHEVRLGLVLYGGVSLAIYMNGTTNELFRAVRGRGVYFLLKHLLDADITVDVASGASAGGINGIFLSFALANELEFGTCADLWRRDGDLGTLLRRLEGDAVPSVLDSEHYRGLLENGFRVMWENESRPPEPERASPTRELDVFVTGTSFYGRYAQAVDSTGRVIETKQHRTVFLLKHRDRAGSKCQLDPRRNAYGRWDRSAKGASEDELDASGEPSNAPGPDSGLVALSKLAQITSCFPGAFSAVHVDAAPEGDGTVLGEANQKLKVWGALPAGEHYFVDGGVLDNKPFTTTLDTIFHRPADRRVCRHMLYLEPDPERFSAERQKQLGEDGRLAPPTFVSTVLDSMTRLPSYESIADDLARIAEHNSLIQRFDELVQGLGNNQGTPAPRGTYLSARLLSIGQRVNAELAQALASVEFVPAGGDARDKTRLTSEVIGALLKKLTEVIQEFPEAELQVLLRKVDVDFYIRRLLALTYALEKKLDGKNEEREVWRYVNQELQWLEIVRGAMERIVVPPWIWKASDGFDERVRALDPGELWDEIERRTLMLLDPGELDFGAPVSAYPGPRATPGEQSTLIDRKDRERYRLWRKLEDRIKDVQGLDTHALAKAPLARTLLEDSDDRLQALAQANPFVKEFLRTFEQREDPLRFPLEFAARVHQRDKINVVRLSPVDAQTGFSRRAFADKICGETFGHFGAFLKKSWRSNDILWGRLDGISRLVETLLEHTRFGGALAPLHHAALLQSLGADSARRRAFLGELFPHLDERLRARSGSRQADPLSKLLAVLEAEPAPDRPTLVKHLVETAQLDVLCEDLPKVIADAAEEQLEWGQRKVGGGKRDEKKASEVSFSTEAWEFTASSGALKTNVLDLATKRFAERALDEMSAVAVGDYFQKKYSVGSESAFLAMPTTVLADLGARAVVLAESALVGSGKIGDSLRENGLYRMAVRYPIRIIAALAAFLRRSPHYRVALVVGFLLYAGLAIVANVFFAGAFYAEDGFRRTVAIWAFVLLPFVALVFAWVMWSSRIGKRLLMGVVAIAAVVALWLKSADLARALHTRCTGACQTLSSWAAPSTSARPPAKGPNGSPGR